MSDKDTLAAPSGTLDPSPSYSARSSLSIRNEQPPKRTSTAAATSLPHPTTGTSLVIQVDGRVPSNQSRISQLSFSPHATRLAALSQHPSTNPVANHRRWQALHIIDVSTSDLHPVRLGRVFGPHDSDFRVFAEDGRPALAWGPEESPEALAAAAAAAAISIAKPSSVSALFGRSKEKAKQLVPEHLPPPMAPLGFLSGRASSLRELESGHYASFDMDAVFAYLDVGGLKKGSKTELVPVEPPIAVSPNGGQLIGRSAEDPTEIYIIRLDINAGPRAALRIPGCVPGHLAPVTHLAYMPGGTSILSLSSDGMGRITNITGAAPGHCLWRFKFDPRGYKATSMAVSPDGKLVTSVWGRQVVRWWPETDALLCYDLDEVRAGEELWPLSLSPGGGMLVCRSEDGIDVLRVEDGASMGRLRWTHNGGNFATAAAVSADGKRMAVGLLNGRIMVHTLRYVEDSALDIDKEIPAEEPPAYSKYDD